MRLEKETPFPKVIYKYSRLDRFIFQQLINQELWFSNSQDFNDPYDCNICFEKKKYTDEEINQFWNSAFHKPKPTVEEISKRVDEWSKDQSLIEKFLHPALKKQLQTVGITCFTTKNYNLLMWSHYAESHRGVCIGYDSEVLKKDFFQYEWVTYKDEFPQVNILDINTFISTIMTIKSKEWEYEDEIRFFQKERLTYPIKPNIIKEIIFGLRTPITQIKSIMHLAHQLNLTQIIFKQAILRNNKFQMQFADLTYHPKVDRIFAVYNDGQRVQMKVLKGWLDSGQ